MASLEDIKATITARLTCEEDFTFEENKGELAQSVRADLAPRISGLVGKALGTVSIDEDGDILLLIKETVHIYVTRVGYSCTAISIPLSLVSTSPLARLLPTVIAQVHGLRSYLKPIAYSLRVFGSYWGPSPPSLKTLHDRYFSPLRQFTASGLAEPTSLSCTYGYAAGQFNDEVNLDTKPNQVSLRIIRQASADQFADFEQFWDKASIADMVGRFSPYLEPLEMRPRSSLRSLLGSVENPNK